MDTTNTILRARSVSWSIGLGGLIVIGLVASMGVSLGHAILAGLLIPIAWIDWKQGIVPDLLLGAGFIAAVIVRLAAGSSWNAPLFWWSGAPHPALMTFEFVLPGLVTALLAYAIRCVGYVLYRQAGMGMGDVKLGFVMGLLIGYGAVGVFYLAVCMAGFIGVIHLAVRNERKHRVPFVPYLLAGSLIYPAAEVMLVWWIV